MTATKKVTAMSKETYKQMTYKIINLFESCGNWESGLSGIVKDVPFPVNAQGNPYSGINVMLLWSSAIENGYTDCRWYTYKKAQELGFQVRKGEKGTQIIFFKNIEKENDSGEKTAFPMVRVYTVFNGSQFDNNLVTNEAISHEWDDIQAGEHLISSMECELSINDVVPCYNIKSDTITLPHKMNFDTPQNYYTTAAHEMIHSTMIESRCNRLEHIKKRGYAFEELIAELGAVFIGKRMGIVGDVENHASYIKGWLKAMKDDPKYIFKASTFASKATEYILDRVE